MAEKITLTIRVHGERQIEVNRAEYEQAKRDGKVDHFLDHDLSDLEGDNTVVEPEGRSYNPHLAWHGPDGPPNDHNGDDLEDAAAAEDTEEDPF